MPCGGSGSWWKSVKNPKQREKARRYYYAQRGRDLAGEKAAAAEARRIMHTKKALGRHERRLKATSIRAKRSKHRSPF
jgi:hypothetical protein